MGGIGIAAVETAVVAPAVVGGCDVTAAVVALLVLAAGTVPAVTEGASGLLLLGTVVVDVDGVVGTGVDVAVVTAGVSGPEDAGASTAPAVLLPSLSVSDFEVTAGGSVAPLLLLLLSGLASVS